MNAEEKTKLEELREELLETNEQLEAARVAMGLDRYSPELLSEAVWKAKNKHTTLQGNMENLKGRFKDFQEAAEKSLNAIRDKINPMDPECPHSDLVAVAGLDLAIDLDADKLESVDTPETETEDEAKGKGCSGCGGCQDTEEA